MDKRDRIVLNKILNETNIISKLIAGYEYETFVNDEKTKRAVCMTLINIGEMVKLLSDGIRRSNPNIQWRSIAGLRDITAHGYQTLRMEDIWVTVSEDVSVLREQINELMENSKNKTPSLSNSNKTRKPNG